MDDRIWGNCGIVVAIIVLWVSCNPYVTKNFNFIDSEGISSEDSIYVVPVVECRRQITEQTYNNDEEAFQVADTLASNALHKLLDSRLNIKYGMIENINSHDLRKLLDSVVNRLINVEYKHFVFNKKFDIPSQANLILIPYLVWTRTTPEFEREDCIWGRGAGRIYTPNSVCTWTKAQTYFFVINRNKREIVYYKDSYWSRGHIWMPYESRITLNFRHCAEPLLQKLARKS